MAMIAIMDVCPDQPSLRLVVTMPNIISAYIRRRRERRLFAELSRLSPHLIRDAGFDPDAVYAAVAGTWDEIIPGGYRMRQDRRRR